MKAHILSFSELWHDMILTAGIVGIFSILGFYAHRFAYLMQSSLFLGDWDLF